MNIQLKEELIMNSYKTLDGRGHNVHISGGACLTLQYVNNIIIHNIHIHDCKSTGPADVRSSPSTTEAGVKPMEMPLTSSGLTTSGWITAISQDALMDL